jgi:Zn-dependent M28 family amino/carboxypeptidase
MPGRSHRGPFSSLSPQETEVAARLSRHVETLAGQIGERNAFHLDALEKAARHVEGSFAEMADTVAAQEFAVLAGQTVRNLEVERKGSERPQEIVVVGAHYDSVIGSPGANDNATGVAALLEVARLLKDTPHRRTLRFVAFVNEEPPFFQSDGMGSLRYARRCRERGENVGAMLSLETMGFYSDAHGSQDYPFPLSLFYPGTADFIAFVGNTRSRALVRTALASFRQSTPFPSEGAAVPGALPGVGWSDHWSFWQAGYPALMVTDTALFRYAPYHTEHDTPEKIRYDRMARVVCGVARVVSELAIPVG